MIFSGSNVDVDGGGDGVQKFGSEVRESDDDSSFLGKMKEAVL